MTFAAPMMKRLSLELGGKNAAVVFADARLDKAIPTLLRASFLNQVFVSLRWHIQLMDQYLIIILEWTPTRNYNAPKRP